jgi:glycosyltransferase involved in cell wall biosynthesis
MELSDTEGKFGLGKRLRIAHVITRLINGGADENTVHSCNWAVQGGHDVILLHGETVHPEIMAKVDLRVKVIAVPDLIRPVSPVADAKALWALTKKFRALKVDIVHTHTSKAGILGRLAAWAAGVPAIVHGVHIVPFVNVGTAERIVYLTLEKATALITSAYINVSEGMRDLCLTAGVGNPKQHHVVHSGFDLARFRNARLPEDWRDLLGVGPILLMVAAFEPRKRHLEFLNVFAKIAHMFPDMRLLLAGDGPLWSQIEARVQHLGLERQVIFAGYRADPDRLIALADLCLLASRREGLPRVVMQYVAGGKPCVVSELPGLDEVLCDGINGRITPADDMEAMADAIVELLEDPKKLSRLAQGASATDLSSWDAKLIGKRIDTIYREVLDQVRVRPESTVTQPVSEAAVR